MKANPARCFFRSFLGVLVAVYLALGLFGAALALLLLVNGETAGGRLFGLGTLILFPAPVLFWIGLYLKRPRFVWAAGCALVVLSFAAFLACWSVSPEGAPGENISSIYLGQGRHVRMSPANMVPEIDQLKLGTYIFPSIDPLIDEAQGVRIRELFLRIYRELGQSEDFNELGSALGYCYMDIMTGKPAGTHAYQYIPDAEGRLPVILFLHGSLGNFKGYMWFWKKFADERGYAIVAPTFGTGNWFLDGGVGAVERARQYCAEHPRMDGSRIYLAGLSNGGTGVTRAARENPEAYAGLIYLSAVIEPAVISDRRYVDGWRGRDVLVVHGAEDNRIPKDYILRAVAGMDLNRVKVASKIYPGEDHFLLFSQPESVRQDIAAWLEGRGKGD